MPFPTRFALIAAEGQRSCGPTFELSRASPVQGTGGPTPCELNWTVKKTKQLKQKNETWNQKISEIEVTVLGARPAKKFAQLQVDFTWDKTGWKLQHELHLCTNKLVRGKTTITSKGNKKLTDDKKERNNSKLGDVGLNTHHFWSKNPCFLVFFPLIWWFFALGFVPWIQWTRSLLQIFLGLCYDSQLLVGQTLFYQSMKRSGT